MQVAFAIDEADELDHAHKLKLHTYGQESIAKMQIALCATRKSDQPNKEAEANTCTSRPHTNNQTKRSYLWAT